MLSPAYPAACQRLAHARPESASKMQEAWALLTPDGHGLQYFTQPRNRLRHLSVRFGAPASPCASIVRLMPFVLLSRLRTHLTTPSRHAGRRRRRRHYFGIYARLAAGYAETRRILYFHYAMATIRSRKLALRRARREIIDHILDVILIKIS